MSIIIQLDHQILLFLFGMPRRTLAYPYLVYLKSRRDLKIVCFCLFMYSCCSQLQQAKNEERETEKNASKSPTRSRETSISNLFTKQDPGQPRMKKKKQWKMPQSLRKMPQSLQPDHQILLFPICLPSRTPAYLDFNHL